ncbi:monocarboxylate transporter 6-like [Haliotis rufescens]|uniref:monocarboxylate transporter 6-like n=1 Tax=Haliotis rufescens TaxID=6454 RepID=UPI001EB00A9B|nr:monocarboxylate transporter 6-like [Haliotis rufescens]
MHPDAQLSEMNVVPEIPPESKVYHPIEVAPKQEETPQTSDHEGSSSAKSPELTSLAKVIVLASCMCNTFLSVGFAVGLGVVFVEILDVFDASRTQTSLMQSLCFGVIFTGALVCGPIVATIGPGNSVILGGVLSLAGCVGATFAPSVNVLIVTIGLITGIGHCFSYLSSYVASGAVLAERKGMGVSLITASSNLGAFVYPQINRLALNAYGWRGTFLLLAGVNFNLCVSGFIIRCLTKPIYQTKSETDPKPKSLARALHLHLLKNGPFVILLLLQMPIWCFYTGEIVFIVDVARTRGYDLEAASFLLSALTVAYVPGNLLGGMLHTVAHIPGLISCSVSLLICGLFSIGFVYFTSYGVMMALVIGHGLLLAVVEVSVPIIVVQITDPTSYSFALSYFFGITGFADISSGPISGAIRDVTGNYLLMFYLAGGSAVLMALVCICLELWMRKKKAVPVEISIHLENC